MPLRPIVAPVAVASVAMTMAAVTCALPAQAQPNGAQLVRLLGARARAAFAPAAAPGMGAIVRLPGGMRAADLGLGGLAPGFARLWGTSATIVSFADAHPGLSVEVSPPLHLLLDTAARYVGATAASAAGHQGANALVGIADTGVDVTHLDFLDDNHLTRIAWLLDLSSPPIGTYPDLEKQYGSTGPDGSVVAGAVWAKADIDALLPSGSGLPRDEIGHGTLVAACAAGRDPRYQGVAPQAGILVARIAEADGSIGNDEMLRGVQFLFDRADAMHEPIAVNLSIGTDFGPHDGTLGFEQVLASHVGPAYPGHALVVAAGNSGSIDRAPVHQNVHVSPGQTVRVPVVTIAAPQSGTVSVWVAMHTGADLSVGLDARYGTWVSPVGSGGSAEGDARGFAAVAGVDNESRAPTSVLPAQSHGAVVTWQGQWPADTYYVTLSGSGTADLYVQGDGDVGGLDAVGFADGVREGTISLPATHPQLIGVGCTINKPSWMSMAGHGVGLLQPVLDPVGGQPLAGPMVEPADGEPCWFSSAGPTLSGQPKPEIMAPGAAVVGAMSQQAPPSVTTSIFNTVCPSEDGGPADDTCLQIDATHAISYGTSFSAPLVTGAVAVLFERDPTLTQDDVVAALQGGAHRLRGAAPFFDDDQSGPGELDVVGALAAVDRLRDPELALPSRSESWMTFGADTYLADGSTPLAVIVELRTARVGDAQPLPADGFAGRVGAYVLVDGAPYGQAPVQRTAPGVWVATVELPPGLGGSTLTVGATLDGVDIVDRRSVPIAADVWSAEYAPSVRGGCSVVAASARGPEGALALAVAASVAVAGGVRRSGRRGRSRRL
jgi:hypothetical protein